MRRYHDDVISELDAIVTVRDNDLVVPKDTGNQTVLLDLELLEGLAVELNLLHVDAFVGLVALKS